MSLLGFLNVMSSLVSGGMMNRVRGILLIGMGYFA